jgi:hypothetical protein
MKSVTANDKWLVRTSDIKVEVLENVNKKGKFLVYNQRFGNTCLSHLQGVR